VGVRAKGEHVALTVQSRISSGVCVPAVCGTEFGLADTREC
jgi:hypothetical protein